jgi:hypothetical protein
MVLESNTPLVPLSTSKKFKHYGKQKFHYSDNNKFVEVMENWITWKFYHYVAHILVLFMTTTQELEAGLLNKRLMLSSSFRCDKFVWDISFWSHFVVLPRSDFDVQQTRLRGGVGLVP